MTQGIKVLIPRYYMEQWIMGMPFSSLIFSALGYTDMM